MKDLLHEFCYESVSLLRRQEYLQAADNLRLALVNLTYEPFDHRSAVHCSAAALQEVGKHTASDTETSTLQALREVLPHRGLADTMAMIIDYADEHERNDSSPSRAEAEFVFSVACAVCYYIARTAESHACGNVPLPAHEGSWRQRSWVRHSLTATIEDKISSLRPRRKATQTELFADMGMNICSELPVDRETHNAKALRKIRAVVSGKATTLEHISNSDSGDTDAGRGKSSFGNESEDEEDGYRSLGVEEPFSNIVSGLQIFVRDQDHYEQTNAAGKHKTLLELRGDAYRSELLYSIGCALCAFLMAVFIEQYR